MQNHSNKQKPERVASSSSFITEPAKRTPSRETTLAIQTKFEEVVAAHKTAVETAVELGNLLIKVKDESPHGFFGNYIDDNFSFSLRTAQRWMKLAVDFSRLSAAEATSLSHLTVEQATRAISSASSTAAGLESATRKKVLNTAEKKGLSIKQAEHVVGVHKRKPDAAKTTKRRAGNALKPQTPTKKTVKEYEKRTAIELSHNPAAAARALLQFFPADYLTALVQRITAGLDEANNDTTDTPDGYEVVDVEGGAA